MSRRNWLIVSLVVLFIGIVVLVTAIFVPQGTNPAYAVALDYVLHVGRGEEASAQALLAPELQAYVAENCPEGRVTACIEAYIPDEWGKFLNAVYRRSQPDGREAWDVQLIATYERGQGFSGVCIYARTEKDPASTGAQYADWRVTRWSGWVSCDDPNTRLLDLIRPEAVHSAP